MKNLENNSRKEEVTRNAFKRGGGAASTELIAQRLCAHEPEGLDLTHHPELN